MWPALIGAGASLLGGWMASSNSAKQQDKANQTNIAQADKTRDWDRESYQNRHQWEVKDLKAAGLNPILSAHQGGSPSGGVQAKVESSAKDQAKNLSLAKLASEIALNYSAKNKMEAEKQKTQAGIPEVQGRSDMMSQIYQGVLKAVKRTSQTAGRQSVKLEQAFRMKKRRLS